MSVARYTKTAFALSVGLLMSSGGMTADAPAGRYVVVFKSDVLPEDAVDRATRAGGKVTRALPEIGTLSSYGDSSFVEAMKNDGDVLAVGPEHLHRLQPMLAIQLNHDDLTTSEAALIPADPGFGLQWNMRRIGADKVWARLPFPAGTPRPIVAVLDSGVADNHLDLGLQRVGPAGAIIPGQIVATKSFSFCNTSGGPNNTPSYPKYSTLIDFDAFPNWTPGEDPCTRAPTIYSGHGTHVAGTIAARLGGGLVVGVAPSAGIAAYKVFDRVRFTVRHDDGSTEVIDDVGAFDSAIFAAIIDATIQGYPVINLSLGGLLMRNDEEGNASWHAWSRVARYATQNGVLIVTSAGNDAVNLNGAIAHVPSDLPSVMSTSATGWSKLKYSLILPFSAQFVPGSHDVLAFYSNTGAPVDVSAPGGDCGPTFPDGCEAPYLILSTFIIERDPPPPPPGQPPNPPAGTLAYSFVAGTSMATPHVSAVAAMVRALHPEWTPGEVRSYLKSTAQKIGKRQQFGHGLIDADAAVR